MTLREDNLIQVTAEKLDLPEALVKRVVNSFFIDGLKYFLQRPSVAKGHIDLQPYFQIKISIPKLRYILSYKTYSKRVMIMCAQLYKLLKENGKKQTGFTDEHERLVESALQRTAAAIQAGEVRGLYEHAGEFSIQRLFPDEADEIQRKYFGTGSEI